MKPTYFIRWNGHEYEPFQVYDNLGDYVDTFATKGEALAFIDYLEAEDQRIHQQGRSEHE